MIIRIPRPSFRRSRWYCYQIEVFISNQRSSETCIVTISRKTMMNALSSFPGGKGTFARGIHPPDRKELCAGSPIEVLPHPAELSIPLLQHLGASCNASVKARDEVRMGDRIGEPGGFVSSPIHASLSGKVSRIAPVTLPNGRRIDSVGIHVAEEQPFTGQELLTEILGDPWPLEDIERMESATIAQAAQEAGLVGLGGAAFPTHVKLTRNPQKPCEFVLINGCECEPYLTADSRIMLEAPEAVTAGALLSQRATGAKQVFICVEDNKRSAINALQQAALSKGVGVLVMKTKYPQGGEKQLIQAATGREVPFGGLPLDVGVVVVNAGTSVALARAVFLRKPLTHRVVSVTGHGIASPKNLWVPVGASYRNLINYCGGLTADAICVVSGGPMMGFTVGNLDTPVTKGTSGITVLTQEEIREADETACLRCGRCVDVCPMRLVPTKLALASRARNVALAEHFYINACMECGSCAYTCPARLPLVQLIRMGKTLVRNAALSKAR